jgi:hypothetical protein
MPKVHLKTAWIVLDGGKLTDILTARKTFDDVVDYAKELYRATRMNFTDKALLAHYNSGTTVRDAAFANLPMETHFTSALYRQLKESEENLEEIGGERHRLLAKRFADGPQYVIVGAPPTVEIRRVLDLEVGESEGGTGEIVTWHEPTSEGQRLVRHKTSTGDLRTTSRSI